MREGRTEVLPYEYGPASTGARLVEEPHRVRDALEDWQIAVVLAGWRYEDGVHQIAVAHLGRCNLNGFALARGIRHVVDRRLQPSATAERDASVARRAAHSRITLSQGVNQLVGGCLQVVCLVARDPHLHAVREDALSVVAAVAR